MSQKPTLRVYNASATVEFVHIPKRSKAMGHTRPISKTAKHPTRFCVVVDAKLRGVDRLDTLIHESLHVADWGKDEVWVNKTATGIAKLLWKLGYRCEKEGV